MTNEQLERRVDELEHQVAELRKEIKTIAPPKVVRETFGIFGDDPEFDEIVRLGREYRQQANSDGA